MNPKKSNTKKSTVNSKKSETSAAKDKQDQDSKKHKNKMRIKADIIKRKRNYTELNKLIKNEKYKIEITKDEEKALENILRKHNEYLIEKEVKLKAKYLQHIIANSSKSIINSRKSLTNDSTPSKPSKSRAYARVRLRDLQFSIRGKNFDVPVNLFDAFQELNINHHKKHNRPNEEGSANISFSEKQKDSDDQLVEKQISREQPDNNNQNTDQNSKSNTDQNSESNDKLKIYNLLN